MILMLFGNMVRGGAQK